MSDLILLRHAKAEAPSGGIADIDRALTLEGRSHAARVGELIADAGLTPDLVIVSPANRTQQTWKRMEQFFPLAEVEVAPELYEGSVGIVQSLLSELTSPQVVLVIGHEPTMSATAAYLAGPESDPKSIKRVALGMSTSRAAHLEITPGWGDLSRRSGRLVQLFSGKR